MICWVSNYLHNSKMSPLKHTHTHSCVTHWIDADTRIQISLKPILNSSWLTAYNFSESWHSSIEFQRRYSVNKFRIETQKSCDEPKTHTHTHAQFSNATYFMLVNSFYFNCSIWTRDIDFKEVNCGAAYSFWRQNGFHFNGCELN